MFSSDLFLFLWISKILGRKEWEEAELLLLYLTLLSIPRLIPIKRSLECIWLTQLRTVSAFILSLSLSNGNSALDVLEVNTPSTFKVSLYCLFFFFFECGWAPRQPVFLKAGMYVITLETYFAVQHTLSLIVYFSPFRIWYFVHFLF